MPVDSIGAREIRRSRKEKMKQKKKTGLALLSFLILWIVEASLAKGTFEIRVASGLGSAVVASAVGIIVGGLVLFNVFLFFYNIFKPRNRLVFNGYDKLIAGLWLMIIIRIFNFI